MPDLHFEKGIWKRGFTTVAGLDEVGRGAFAGPVVAACVCFPGHLAIEHFGSVHIDDSKKLTHKERLLSDKWIRKNALVWGIGEVSSYIIDKTGIGKASIMAFRKAINEVNRKLNSTSGIEFLLIDAFYVPYVRGIRRNNQLPITHGDGKSLSIAAASIIAKVYRDNIMMRLSGKSYYISYDWAANKGYGTLMHRDAILKHGISNYHRKSFLKTMLKAA